MSFVFNNIKHGIWNSDGTQILSMGYGTTAHGLGRPVDRFQAKKSCKFWIVLVTWLFFYLDNLRSCQDEGRILWVGWWHRFSQQVACQVRWLLPFVSYHTKPNLSRISHHIASYRIIWHHTYFACLISMFPIQSVATFTYFYKLQTEQIYQHGAPLQVASRSPTRLRLVSSCGSSQMWIRMDQALPFQMYSHAGYMCTYYHYIIPST